MAEGQGATVEGGEGYATGMRAGATLLTIFMPFIALIAALVMMGGERSPVRRAFLRTWAWISGGVLILATFVAIAVVASVANPGSHVDPSGPCVGGPVIGAAGVQVGPNRFRFPCADGGSTVVDFGSAGSPTG